jgi:voltage-gated potassium channel Kch
MNKLISKCRKSAQDAGHAEGHDEHHEHRDIVMLGFHRIGSMLIHEFEIKNPGILKRMNVVDVNQSIKPRLEKKGVHYSYGDISSADVLEHAHHGEAKLILSTIPDSVLGAGVTNQLIVREAMKCWPGAIIIATAESHAQKKELYQAGAHYVLVQTQLCAERLQDLLGNYIMDAFHDGELNQLVAKHAEQKETLSKARFSERGPTKTLVI